MAPVIKGSQIQAHDVEDYSPHRFVREKQRQAAGGSISEAFASAGSGSRSSFEQTEAWSTEEAMPGFEKLLDIQARLRFLLKEIQEYSQYKK
jgi:hypothetical protein